MKTMNLSTLILVTSLLLFIFPVYSESPGITPKVPEKEHEDEEEGKPYIHLILGFGSNFIDRGEDTLSDRAVQNHKKYGSHTGAPHFAPNVILETPLEGMTFDLWFSFAMTGRNDKDIDRVLQTQSYGTDLVPLIQTGDQDALEKELQNPECLEQNGCMPGYQKEPTGLSRNDRIIFTWLYETESKPGLVGGGITSDGFVNAKDKEGPTTELFFAYSPFFLPWVRYELYIDIGSPGNYHSLGISEEWNLTDKLVFDAGIRFGYGVLRNLQGMQDVTADIQFFYEGFFIGATAAYRPNLAFFDTDEAVPVNRTAGWLTGRSSNTDGLVADPSRLYGPVNVILNQQIQNFLDTTNGPQPYQYTPRQKLPRILYAFRIGYEFRLM